MVAKIDIDALKIFFLIKNKRGWKLAKNQKQPVLTLDLLILKKTVYFDLFTFEKFWNLLLLFTKYTH